MLDLYEVFICGVYMCTQFTYIFVLIFILLFIMILKLMISWMVYS